jgi:hypothetical protein
MTRGCVQVSRNHQGRANQSGSSIMYSTLTLALLLPSIATKWDKTLVELTTNTKHKKFKWAAPS